ncbi:NUDIX hydrolase [Coralloluteibacterium thermophilus]|uniref:Phosphatase NudJ n=1 Tax=Coralloluteibacterium thermophilum TaxID=2707049 RepID=A0ABV9NQ62_9GAMM
MIPPSPAARWHPDTTVAAIVVRDGRLLVVEERVGDALVLNQPAGHLEAGESLLQAVCRETLEETGWEIEPVAFVGAYQWAVPDDGREFLRMAFAARPLRHDPERRLDAPVERALWLSPQALAAEAARHRSPLVWRVVADWLAGQRFPLSAVQRL